MNAVDSPYLTSEEAIAYLRLDHLRSPQSALYRLIVEHRMPHQRIGRLHRFDKRELDAWMRGFESALERMRVEKSAKPHTAESESPLRLVQADKVGSRCR